ncbi:MAG: hypothetical protein PHR20_09350, partial [Bacteroidales bacterium]|nr:hypothetical protein [Bacteroidales bacterium]
AIKSSIEESNNFEVEVSMLTTMDIKTIENYDIIVTHGLPDKSAKSKLLFDKIKEAEMPSLTIISSNTDIEQLNNIDNNIRIESNNEQTEEAYPVFNNKFSAYKVDKEDEAVYNSFSPLNAPFGIYNLPAQSEILFYQKISDITTTRPLIALLQDFNIRHAYIFGEGIWLWKIKNYVADGSHRTFNSLVNNILQYLSLSDLFSFFRVETREEYYEGEDITINAFLYNDNYELYNTADAQMIVKNEISEVEFPHYFSASDDGSYSLNMGGLPEGRYSWHATAGDKVADGAFYVGKTNPEYYNMQANHKMLQAAAEITGGKFVTLTDADKLIRALQEDINNDKTFTVKQQKNLSSIIAIFAIIVLLLGIEWLLRRRAGIY